LFALSAFSDSFTNAQGDSIVFFKRAMSSPQDVASYTVSQRDIENNRISYYVGARAGSNYFLEIVSSSNALLNLSQRQLITGRSGTDAYQFSQNAVSFGIGSNALTGGVDMLFALTRQFLDMGIGNIKPESVKWSGDTFTATDNFGLPQYGELKTANELPSQLEISNAKGPYKLVKYVYPDPPSSFNGFPSKMLLLGEYNGKFNKGLEVVFYSVQLATEPLTGDFFSAAQFVGSNILHTNTYRDADLYVQNRRGQTVKATDSVRKSSGLTNSRSRAVIFLCFALITAIPIALTIILRPKQTNQRK